MQAVVRSRKSVLAGAVQAALAAGLLLHGGSAIAQYDEGGYDSSGTSSVQGAPAGEGSMGATQVTPADAGQGSDAGASGTYGQDSVQGQGALQDGQTPPPDTGAAAPGAQGEHAGQPDSEWHLAAGLGVGVGPRYMGSDETRATAAGMISVQYGMFQLDPQRGLGLQYETSTGTKLRLGLGYQGSRKDHRKETKDGHTFSVGGSDKLAGMGNVRGAGLLTAGISQRITSWLELDLDADTRLFGNSKRGTTWTYGVTLTPLQTEADRVQVGLHAQHADRKYHQTWFGVTPEQSQRTGFATFSPDSGQTFTSVGMLWSHTFTPRWSLLAGGEVQKFSKDIRRSAVVMDDTTATAMVGVLYSFF